MPGNDQIFIGWDNPHNAFTFRSTDGITIDAVLAIIKIDAEMLEALTNPPAHRRGFLSYAAGKYESINTAKHSSQGADMFPEVITKHLDCLDGMGLAFSFFQKCLHVRTD